MILSHERPSIVFPLALFLLPPSIVALSRSVSCLVLSPSPGICLSCREKQTTGPSRGPLPCYGPGSRTKAPQFDHKPGGAYGCRTLDNHWKSHSRKIISMQLKLVAVNHIRDLLHQFCRRIFRILSKSTFDTEHWPKIGEIIIFVFSAVVKLKFQYFVPLGRL